MTDMTREEKMKIVINNYFKTECSVNTSIREAFEKGFRIGASKVQNKHGKFIGTEYDGYADGNPVYYEWKCSECGCVFEEEEPTYRYCPNCGARMRGEAE